MNPAATPKLSYIYNLPLDMFPKTPKRTPASLGTLLPGPLESLN